MSGSEEEDELAELLAHSGSEYEPSGSEADDSDIKSADSLSSDSDPDTNNKKKRKKVKTTDKKRKKLPPRNNTQRNNVNKRINTHPVSYKPFEELMTGVIFSMSGFINPLRSELRTKALGMGCQYLPDWDNTCTHLVCAFQNTPKYEQVRGNGKIVTKEWIEDCYSKRKRLPWRRYALEWRESNKSESEGEIHELDSSSNSTTN